MATGSDRMVRLRDGESSVLVQDAPLDDVDSVDVVETDSHHRVDVRFGRVPADSTQADADTNPNTAQDEADADGGERVLVAPEAVADSSDTTVYTVGGPADLTGYGVAVDKVLDDVDDPLLVTIDSVTTLLQYTELADAFRFVHVLTGRLAREDAVLLAGIDADAHDDKTVATMLQPFDVTVTTLEGPQIRRRD